MLVMHGVPVLHSFPSLATHACTQYNLTLINGPGAPVGGGLLYVDVTELGSTALPAYFGSADPAATYFTNTAAYGVTYQLQVSVGNFVWG